MNRLCRSIIPRVSRAARVQVARPFARMPGLMQAPCRLMSSFEEPEEIAPVDLKKQLDIEIKDANELGEEFDETASESEFFTRKVDGANLVFTRDLGGEQITIRCNVNDLFSDEGEEAYQEEEGDEDMDMDPNEDAEDPENNDDVMGVRTTIEFSKAGTKPMVVTANAFSQMGWQVLSVHMGELSEGTYVGPKVPDLDEDLITGFYCYLEDRKIDKTLAETIVGNCFTAEHTLYADWLLDASKYVNTQ